MAAPSWILFMSQACLNVAKKPIIEIGSFRSKKCAFIYDMTISTSLIILLDTVPSYFKERFASRCVE